MLKKDCKSYLSEDKILDEAEKDIAIGISFYEAQKDALGKYFLDSILSDIGFLHIYAVLDCRKNPNSTVKRL